VLQWYKRLFSWWYLWFECCFVYNYHPNINPREARCDEGSFSASIFALFCPCAIGAWYIISFWKVWLVSNWVYVTLFSIVHSFCYSSHKWHSDRIDSVFESGPFTQKKFILLCPRARVIFFVSVCYFVSMIFFVSRLTLTQ